MTILNQNKMTLGIVGVIVSLVVLAVNPFQPQVRTTPEAVRSPVIEKVWVGLYAADGETEVDASWDDYWDPGFRWIQLGFWLRRFRNRRGSTA